eukprot:7312163-Alexandrium_andersonii.AAC.1
MAEGKGAFRKTGVLWQILEFKFSGGCQDRVHAFRQLARDYNRTVDAGNELDDDARIVTLIQGRPQS